MSIYKHCIVTVVFLFLAACSSSTQTVSSLSVAIIPISIDASSVPASNHASQRAKSSLSNQMLQAGASVYDLNASDYTGRLSSADAIDLAKSAERPLDAVVVFDIHSTALDNAYNRKHSVTLNAKLVYLPSGRVGQVAQPAAETFIANSNCFGLCLQHKLGDVTARLAAEAGAILVDSLPAVKVSNPPAANISQYTLRFEGFKASQLSDIEQNLRYAKGYQSLRLNESGGTYAHYWYKSRLTTADMTRFLRNMAIVDASRLSVQQYGNEFLIKPVTLRPRATPSSDYDW